MGVEVQVMFQMRLSMMECRPGLLVRGEGGNKSMCKFKNVRDARSGWGRRAKSKNTSAAKILNFQNFRQTKF